jgi:hypothetical protein
LKKSSLVSIDDLKVKIGTAQEQEWHVLFNEDFERFIDEEQLKDSGWVQVMTLNQTAESVTMKIKTLATDELSQHGRTRTIFIVSRRGRSPHEKLL